MNAQTFVCCQISIPQISSGQQRTGYPLPVQVTNRTLQWDFLAMATTEEWRDKVKMICSIPGVHSGASMSVPDMNAAVSAAAVAISRNTSHPVRRLQICPLEIFLRAAVVSVIPVECKHAHDHPGKPIASGHMWSAASFLCLSTGYNYVATQSDDR